MDFSTLFASSAKGSVGETVIYKVFWPHVENPVLRCFVQLLCFIIAAPWFISWWGLVCYFRMFYYFVILGETFELNYKQILSSVGSVKGVLHVGASFGQEAEVYAELAVPCVLWIEAQEECREHLKKAISTFGRRDDQIAITALAASEGKAVLFGTDNSISSSLKPLGAGHHTYFPFITKSFERVLHTETLDSLLARLCLDPRSFDFLYLDVQGSELDVLHGSTLVLPHIKYVMTEISSIEHYQGGCLETDLHSFLVSAGFRLVQRKMPPLGHGNAFYSR